MKYFINQMGEAEAQKAQVHLNTLVHYCESSECRRIPLLEYFGETYGQKSCGQCDNCLASEQPLLDLTEAAQKFLSCVVRTGQVYGASYVTDVLRGSKNQKVLDRGHDSLSTYGIGKKESKQEWFFIGNELLKKGFLEQNEHGGLFITSAAKDLLKGRERFMCRFSPIQTKQLEKSAKKSIGKKAPSEVLDEALFEALRNLRREFAEKNSVPPYVIFSDKSLVEMANEKPQSDTEFLMIHGVGNSKLEKFGESFLALIRQF